MRIALALILGLLLGAFLEEGGFIVGCLVGYLLGEQRRAAKRIRTLEAELGRLASTERSTVTMPPAAAPSEPASTATPPEEEVVEALVTEAPAAAPPEEEPVYAGPAAIPADSPEAAAGEPVHAPAGGGQLAEVFAQVRAFVFGGNTLVRVGVVILFIGFAFLVKYAVDNAYFPLELRLAATAAAGIGLAVVGWRLRERRPDFALALQGGGAAVLYLTIFAAYRLYGLLPGGAAFALLVATTVFCAVLALLQHAQSLIVLSLLGGFFAPVLASTGTGSHVALFSYFVVLNGAVLALAWLRPWRVLHLVGFFCTFGIAGLWVADAYTPELFASTESFLVLFFLCYFAIALIHARRRTPRFTGFVDGTLVFGLPVVVFSLQATLVRTFPYGLAWSALVLGAFYAVVAYVLFRRVPETLRVLVESFAGIGLVLGTMVLPFALDATWTGTGWALEGAALVWLGFRQQRVLLRLSGVVLQVAAAVSFITGAQRLGVDLLPLANRLFLGYLALSLSALYTAYLMQVNDRERRPWEAPFEALFLLAGVVWWLAGGIGEIVREIDSEVAFHLIVVHVAVTALLCALLWRPLGWRGLRVPSLLLLPALALLLMGAAFIVPHPFADAGWLAWPLGLGVHLLALRRADADVPVAAGRWLHAGGLWLAAVVLAWEAGWWLGTFVPTGTVWAPLSYGLVPVLLVLVVVELAAREGWPFGAWRSGYLLLGIPVLLVGVWYWSMQMTPDPADPAPLPYLPIANPLDLVLGLAVVGSIMWYRTSRRLLPSFGALKPGYGLAWALAATLFWWLNGTLARTVHAWAGVPYDLGALLASSVFQTALTIFWASLSVSTMAVSARHGHRTPWIVAAALLGVTVLKLFVFDLSSLGTVARIVAFLVVGMLLLLVGYLAPVPPQRAREVSAPEEPVETPV